MSLFKCTNYRVYLGDPRIKLDERTEKIEQILKMTYTQTVTTVRTTVFN